MRIEYINSSHRVFPEVILLGKKNAATLGFMPEGGFIDHANKKWIVVAYDDADEFAGYLMFRTVPRLHRIAIVHLCVKDAYRGRNVSSLLLDALRDKYKNSTFSGILLSCRSDYVHANQVWKRYGFVCKNNKRSRSIDENYLNIWWYDFNAPDLFSIANQSSIKIKVLLDANIIIKLRDNEVDYDPAEDPRCLMADWLTEEIDYFYAPEINNEITRDNNKDRANRTRIFLSNFIEAKFDVEECKKVVNELKKIIGGKTDNDHSDRVQLATAITSTTPYFVTLDIGIIERRNEIEDNFNIQIFTPQELILEIDQLFNKEEYSPVKLAGVTFHSIAKVSNLELNTYIDTFLKKSRSEIKKSFQSIVYNEIANIKNSRIEAIKTHTGESIAFMGYKYVENNLIVSFLRLSDNDYNYTLFMQLVSDFVNKALKKGLTKVFITERFLSQNQELILYRMGFENLENCWSKNILTGIVDSFSIKGFDSYPLFQKLRLVKGEERIEVLMEIERKFFPLKFSDLDIPCYIIPIKPHWAGQMFDPYISGPTLFGADEKRIWNFENVYYRSTRPITEIAPARILWYASKDTRTHRSKAIIATSYLDEVMTGKPKCLFRQNKHYGIYEWKNIYDLCKKNIDTPIRALRFSRTEVFEKPLSLALIWEIFIKHNRKPNTFSSPVLVGKSIFNEIYQLGTDRGN